jgi:glutathione S-transferase
MIAAIDVLERGVGDGASWLCGGDVGQADITTAIIWRFVQHAHPDRTPARNYPGLVSFSARAEKLPQFLACPLS